MRSKLIVASLLMANLAYAREPKAYQSGKLLQMDSVSCGASQRNSDLRCQEYVLQSENVVYRIRPRNQKHAVLLPVSERAKFRLEKSKLLLCVEDFDGKEREYIVISITPRTDSNTADAGATHVNHLQ